jgi:two-component system response regulator LytT
MKSLRIVIIEDEQATARSLAGLLERLEETVEIISMLDSIDKASQWFVAHQDGYDLVFMDIRLADGLSFEIFKQTPVTRPVIFVTAYNDYAIEAFKNNGIDYILKPFNEQEVGRAMHKFKTLITPSTHEPAELKFTRLLAQFNAGVRAYKRSFLLHYRGKLLPVETTKIAWFHTSQELVYAHTEDGREYHVEFTLEQLEEQLDPGQFYRANRQFIINRQSILEVEFYFNGRLLIKLKPEPPERVLISKARAQAFRQWMNS